MCFVLFCFVLFCVFTETGPHCVGSGQSPLPKPGAEITGARRPGSYCVVFIMNIHCALVKTLNFLLCDCNFETQIIPVLYIRKLDLRI